MLLEKARRLRVTRVKTQSLGSLSQNLVPGKERSPKLSLIQSLLNVVVSTTVVQVLMTLFVTITKIQEILTLATHAGGASWSARVAKGGGTTRVCRV
jgi:hypothetical protein